MLCPVNVAEKAYNATRRVAEGRLTSIAGNKIPATIARDSSAAMVKRKQSWEKAKVLGAKLSM